MVRAGGDREGDAPLIGGGALERYRSPAGKVGSELHRSCGGHEHDDAGASDIGAFHAEGRCHRFDRWCRRVREGGASPAEADGEPPTVWRHEGELRRGGLVLAVLGQLRTEHYGYTLRKALAGRGVPVDEGTLYPLLRRLESQGLLLSEWREEEKRQKRFYRLSPVGRRIADQLAADWDELNRSIARILEDSQS